ncbi:MAG: ATP synthase F1 subunit epsilon [Lachnospiraceae bacterium]|nr:ATP synthase F1 subunit epsilon [Lachnospiraceae bacterium]
MAETMKLQVVTPDKEFFNGDVTMVELNTADGEMGIYPQHIPLTVAVEPGVLRIHESSEVRKAALLSGFIQVMPEKMTILAEACEWPEEIDGARANEARIRAERRLTEHSPETDLARAEAALQRALVRLSLSEGNK